jgi:RNA polymerase sigma-70 factor (ECF subfamily)
VGSDIAPRWPASPTTPEEFAAVIAAARRGEQWALAELYGRLQPKLLGYLRGRCGDDAEDVAADVWIGVARALREFDGDEDAFRRLLFTVAWRRQADRARRRSRKATVALDDDTPYTPVAAAAEMVALDRIAADAAVAEIRNALSGEQADVVLLRVLADISVEEVAAIVGKRPGAVRALQHRALRRLARQYPDRGVTP